MDTKRLILFVIFSFSILMLWESWQRQNAPLHKPVVQQHAADQSIPQASQDIPAVTNNQAPAVPAESGFQLANSQRITVETDLYKASIDSTGGDLRRLELLKHRAADVTDKNFVLMDDSAKPTLYVAQTGLIGSDLPTHKAIFTSVATSYKMAAGSQQLEVRLSWVGGNGLQVDKIYTFHRGKYTVDVSYQIQNGSAAAITPSVYYQIVHDNQSNQGSMMMPTFTGGAYYSEETKYKKLAFAEMEKNNFSKFSKDGWVGLVQLYFVSAWIPKEGLTREFYTKKLDDRNFAIGSLSALPSIAPGTSSVISAKLYSGPQTQDELKATAPGLEYTVDYGWLTIIASPLFWVLSKIYDLVQNWGIAIILLTVLIKAAFYPLSAASYRSMAHMREIAPRMQSLKEKYGDDRVKFQQAMMEMYKTEKINPMGVFANAGANPGFHCTVLGATGQCGTASCTVHVMDQGFVRDRPLLRVAATDGRYHDFPNPA